MAKGRLRLLLMLRPTVMVAMEASGAMEAMDVAMAMARGRLRLLPLLSLLLMLRPTVMEATEATEATVVAMEATDVATAMARGRLRLLLMLRPTVMEVTEATGAMEVMEAMDVAMDMATESRSVILKS